MVERSQIEQRWPVFAVAIANLERFEQYQYEHSRRFIDAMRRVIEHSCH